MDTIEYLSSNARYALYAIFAIVLLSAILTASPAAAVASSILLLCSVVYSGASHIINPMLARRSGIVLVASGYHLSANNKAAIRMTEGGYRAVSMALLTPSSRIANEGKKFEEILSKCRFPFEFSIAVRGIDRKKITDSLETKRRMKEIDISRTSPSKFEKISHLRRELGMIEGEIESITKGSLPIESLVRIRTTSFAETEAHAANDAVSQAVQLSELFNITYSLGYRLLIGEELLRNIAD